MVYIPWANAEETRAKLGLNRSKPLTTKIGGGNWQGVPSEQTEGQIILRTATGQTTPTETTEQKIELQEWIIPERKTERENPK